MRTEYILFFIVLYALIGHLFFTSWISEDLSQKVIDFIPPEMASDTMLFARLICLFIWPFIILVAFFAVIGEMITERTGSGD